MRTITINDIAVMLGFISADCDRETWVKVAAAIKSEFGEAGFDVWDNWSSTADCYKEKEARTVWKGLRNIKAGIGSLIAIAKDAGYQFEQQELTAEQKQQQQAEQRQRKQAREQQAALDAEREAAWHARIAATCKAVWDDHIKPTGSSPYLGRKKVQAFDIGFFRQGVIIEVDEPCEAVNVYTGADDIRAFYDGHDHQAYKAAGKWFVHAKRGTIAVPVCDDTAKLWNLQLIFSAGNKQFIKNGRKSGCFHFIGEYPPADSTAWLLACEGYATGASLHMASGDPVAVAFDAGNLVHVAKTLRDNWPQAQLLFCGDNDVETHGNPGMSKATEAAKLTGGRWCVPDFVGAA